MFQPVSPIVSVIIPASNAGAFMEDAVQSVKDQTYFDWEILIVDDGTTDGSDQAAILAHYADDPRIQVLATKGCQGAGLARNLGMEAAKGRYIAFLDADDIRHSQKLSLQLEAM